jgi:predicted nucleic acid-binding protein
VKAFFDTSVLVPVFYGDHQHHERSLTAFIKYSKSQACCGAHSVAEVYSTLTRMPGKYRIGPEQAILFVEDLYERLTIVALDGAEYRDALQGHAALGIVGGAIYDALLGQCALKAKAEIVYTWNAKHYGQLGPDLSKRLRTP